ncbi:Zinc finger protein 714 [Plecturocebus cupreus]
MRLDPVAHACNPSTSGGLMSEIQDQPGQHGKTLSALKIQKLAKCESPSVAQGGVQWHDPSSLQSLPPSSPASASQVAGTTESPLKDPEISRFSFLRSTHSGTRRKEWSVDSFRSRKQQVSPDSRTNQEASTALKRTVFDLGEMRPGARDGKQDAARTTLWVGRPLDPKP